MLVDRRQVAMTSDSADVVHRRRVGGQIGGALGLLVLFLAGLQFELRDTITLAGILGLVLLPCWVRSLREYSGGLLLIGSIVLALASGIWLAELGKSTHAVTEKYLVNNGAILAEVLVTVCVVLWVRKLVPLWMIGLSYGLGLLGNIALTHAAGSGDDPWKFVYSVPVVFTVLALLMSPKRRALSIMALVALAVVSVAFDSRSLMAELMIAALLVAWQLIPARRSSRLTALRTVLILGVIGFAVYNVGTTLLVDGALGSTAQQRTITQIDTAGSVLLGGRPEMAATLALIAHQPWGYGLGVVPTTSDVEVAKTGMAAINYDPNNGYVENYMFGTTFELHSMVGDLWASYGIPGLLMLAIMVVLIVRWIAVGVAFRHADALTLYLAILTLWNVPFSPFYTSAPVLGVALGLMLLPRNRSPLPRRRDAYGAPPGPYARRWDHPVL